MSKRKIDFQWEEGEEGDGKKSKKTNTKNEKKQQKKRHISDDIDENLSTYLSKKLKLQHYYDNDTVSSESESDITYRRYKIVDNKITYLDEEYISGNDSSSSDDDDEILLTRKELGICIDKLPIEIRKQMENRQKNPTNVLIIAFLDKVIRKLNIVGPDGELRRASNDIVANCHNLESIYKNRAAIRGAVEFFNLYR